MNDCDKSRARLLAELAEMRRREKEIEDALANQPLGAKGGFPDITERSEAKRGVQESEEKFRLLFERSPDATFLMDGDVCIDCNEAALKLARCATREDVIGRHASAAAPVRQPDGQLSVEKGEEEYGRVVRERANRFSWVGRAADGEEYYVEVSQTMIPIRGKEILYTVARDIGHRVRAERELRESEERYRVAVEHSNDGVAIVRDTRHLYVNQRFVDIFGLERPEDILGKDHEVLVHPDDQAMVRDYATRRQANRPAPSRYEFKGVRRDGTTFFGEASAVRITYFGEPAILSYFRDITERKRSEEALKESEERYRNVVQLSPSGIIICVEGVVRFVNRSLMHLLGAETPEGLYGMEVLRFAHPDCHDAVREMMGGIEIERIETHMLEQKWVRLDGSTIDVAVTGFPFKYGGRDAVMAFVEDISQRKNAEEVLKRRERELENKSLNLEEANTALKVLLKHRDEDKRALENAILGNVKELVLPYIDKLRSGHLSDHQLAYLAIIESGLNDIISPFMQKMTAMYSRFTPTEVQIVNMIKGGKTTKEIAELLHIGKATVDSHRNNIRNKLGLRNKKTNLQTFLLSV